jgi:ubiquinone/menaquinone biosynthesis C-methylase UbiE
MEFSGRLADLQRSASRTADYAARRMATLRALSPTAGEAILDVGCGSGLFVKDMAAAVGPTGKVCGIDLSEDQLNAARTTCLEFANVKLGVGSAVALPYPAASFDAVTSIQVLEYLDVVPRALSETPRAQTRRASGKFRHDLGNAVLELTPVCAHEKNARRLGRTRAAV